MGNLERAEGDSMIDAGTAAPDFTLPDHDGNDVSLSDLKGKAVVLFFGSPDVSVGR